MRVIVFVVFQKSETILDIYFKKRSNYYSNRNLLILKKPSIYKIPYVYCVLEMNNRWWRILFSDSTGHIIYDKRNKNRYQVYSVTSILSSNYCIKPNNSKDRCAFITKKVKTMINFNMTNSLSLSPTLFFF